MNNKKLDKNSRPHVLTRLAMAQNTTPVALVTAALTKRGSVLGAAKELGVATGTIYHHLRKMNLTVKRNQSIELEKEHDFESTNV